MKFLVSISSCEEFEKNGLNDTLRKTWLPEAVQLGMDYRFFHGEGSTAGNDIVVLPVVDALYGLSEKAKAKAKWAVENNYDFVFSCFPDTYLRPERLLATDFAQWDYVGNVYQHKGSAPYCQGGCGYVLSRRACTAIYTSSACYLNDDCFIGDVLSAAGIEPHRNYDFLQAGGGPTRSNTTICSHLSPRGLTMTSMEEEHNRWLQS